MKISFITPRLGKDWANTAKYLIKKGHEVKAVCPLNENPNLAQFKSLGMGIIPIYMPRPKNLARLIFDIPITIAKMVSIFKKERPDIVYYFTFPSSLWARIAAWFAGIPVRVSKINGPAIFDMPFFLFLELATAFMDTTILASSRIIENTYKRLPFLKKKVYLNYFGFIQEQFDPKIDGSKIRKEFKISENVPFVVMIGLMYLPRKWLYKGKNIKGHDIFIRAIKIVKESNPNIRFMVVGDDALPGIGVRDELEKMAAQIGIKDVLVFAGYRTDIPDILAAADLAVVPSRIENVGGAVEPLLMGKPVVASNVGGLPDVVIDGVTGLLVPSENPEALAKGILKLLSLSSEARQQMGNNGRKIIKELFDLYKVTDTMEKIFSDELNRQK